MLRNTKHMTRHLGSLLSEHHAERAIMRRERERLESERRDREALRTHIVSMRQGDEPDTVHVEYADGSTATWVNASKRPRGWPEGG